MNYRRDNTDDEHIPLPIETVYNSNVDALRTTKKYENGTKIDHRGNEHFNRLYFKYPPEWKTSNVGEKINGVRKMSIHWRDGMLNLMLYIDQMMSKLSKKLKRIIVI
ncbi:hypothetical protein M9Y10_007997 [Tritrichomonas musculus]|uniref:Uncharacterized protein n=1 Tax=Tritrichomonas musculus TaxID=1915356 RepID=A0ABR2J3N2_9EUKA